jgi:hypothetical protein
MRQARVEPTLRGVFWQSVCETAPTYITAADATT